MPFFLWHCSEDPLVDDLSNSNLSIDTLVVSEIFGENYMVAPNMVRMKGYTLEQSMELMRHYHSFEF